ncbi:MAG: hypothetical protein OXU94_00140 [Gammaproteobacteria bacterium]|nr:hypothetical protein [Gammaproteobacteria bacterium]
MAQAATMNIEIFRALRDSGMEEQYATRVAGAIPPADSIATKADIADLRAAIPERDNFAAKSEVAVVQTKVKTVEAAIIRIDETLARMDERFVRIDERFNSLEKSLARTDEKVNALQSQNRLFIIPLLLLLVATMFGLLTKGILWGVTP